MDRFFEILRDHFEELISQKTGWGKNEVMRAFDKAFAYSVAKFAAERKISLD